MRRGYPSDIKPEQFEVIRPLLESSRKRTAPRQVDLYEVFLCDAVPAAHGLPVARPAQ